MPTPNRISVELAYIPFWQMRSCEYERSASNIFICLPLKAMLRKIYMLGREHKGHKIGLNTETFLKTTNETTVEQQKGKETIRQYETLNHVE